MRESPGYRPHRYWLGAVLYELLTGNLPNDVRQASIPEAVRIVREDDATFRQYARREQTKRWSTGCTTDGYDLYLPDGSILPRVVVIDQPDNVSDPDASQH